MLKFNNNHIITGQIKQILSTFNLPTYRVYTSNTTSFPTIKISKDKDTHGLVNNFYKTHKLVQYFPYIKDNAIQYYVYNEGEKQYKWEIAHYGYTNGEYIQNNTKHLEIKNNIYDSYTHEYLGDYLRFKRDYEHLDLMPMYNCFSDRIFDHGKLTISAEGNDKHIIATFDASDDSSKIYIVPLKLFKNYTIAIDCEMTVELCCGMYDKYINTSTNLNELSRLTYQKFHSLAFSKPILYTKLAEFSEYIKATGVYETAKHEQDIKLFIKLPKNNDSSIVILEGDYRNYNDSKLIVTNNTWERVQNYSIINFSIDDRPDFSKLNLITPLQLLRANTKEQHPFADRLIEYLCDNAITHTEEIFDNIRRVQTAINYGTKYGIGPTTNENDNHYIISNLKQDIQSGWDNTIRAVTYDQLNRTLYTNKNDINHDIFGYVDKDIEKYFYTYNGKFDKQGNKLYDTISSIDLYTNRQSGLYDEDEEDNN